MDDNQHRGLLIASRHCFGLRLERSTYTSLLKKDSHHGEYSAGGPHFVLPLEGPGSHGRGLDGSRCGCRSRGSIGLSEGTVDQPSVVSDHESVCDVRVAEQPPCTGDSLLTRWQS